MDGSNGVVRYTLTVNTAYESRTGVIVIAGQPFTIVQLGDPLACGHSISPASQAYNPSPTTGVVSVTTQAGCAWTVLNSNAWVTILSSTSNSGSGQVLYSVADNTASTAGRTGVVLIAGQPFTVSQPPGIVLCTYSISPTNRVHGHGATNGFISVITQLGCEWSVFNSNGWMTILSGTNGSGSGPVLYSVSANTSSSTRSGNIHMAGRVLSISQSPGPSFPPVVTGPANQTILEGGTTSFSVTTSGTAPFTFQWRRNGTDLVNGGNVSGATTSGLTLTAVTTNDAASYTVVVSNPAGSVTSVVAVLTVISPNTPPRLVFNGVAPGNNLILAWPTNMVGFTLQSATNLTSPVVWIGVTNPPVVLGGQYTVTNSFSGGNKFYRLRKP